MIYLPPHASRLGRDIKHRHAHDCKRINYYKRWSDQFRRRLDIHPNTVHTEVISVIAPWYRKKLVGPVFSTMTPHGAIMESAVAGDVCTGYHFGSDPAFQVVPLSREPHNWIVSRSGMSGCAPRRRTRSSCRGELFRSSKMATTHYPHFSSPH